MFQSSWYFRLLTLYIFILIYLSIHLINILSYLSLSISIQDLDKKYQKTLKDNNDMFASRMAEVNANYQPNNNSNNNNGGGISSKDQLDVEIAKLTAECERQQKILHDSFQDSIQFLLDGYNRYFGLLLLSLLGL